MLFESTRQTAPAATAEEAIAAGLAPDGGLYVPQELPVLDIGHFDGVQSLPDVATRLLAPFFDGSTLAPALGAICSEAFDFPVPVLPFDDSTDVLELFHGPTAAFTDRLLERKTEHRIRIRALQMLKARMKTRCLNYAIQFERQLGSQRA